MNTCWGTEHPLIVQDLQSLAGNPALPWHKLRGRSILVTGATGLIGTLLVKALLYACERQELGLQVQAVFRSRDKADAAFGGMRPFMESGALKLIRGDVREPLPEGLAPDYIIHAASVTSSREMLERPVDTITTTMDGTRNVLELARACGAASCVFLSSLEVYGKLQKEKLAETDSGYLDVSVPRNSYPISKRAAENLCVCYAHQYGMNVNVARLTQTFGPGVSYQDGRVFAQFARSVIEGRDIVLLTKGGTKRDYLYTADAAAGILGILLNSERCGIYNVSNEDSYISILEMAELFCQFNPNCHVRIEENEERSKQYLDEIHISLDNSRLNSLFPFPRTPLRTQVARLLEYMKTFQSPES